jgi:hypothetical protein
MLLGSALAPALRAGLPEQQTRGLAGARDSLKNE